VRLPNPSASHKPSADEFDVSSTHNTTLKGLWYHNDNPSRSVAAARGCVSLDGPSIARSISFGPDVIKSRVRSASGAIVNVIVSIVCSSDARVVPSQGDRCRSDVDAHNGFLGQTFGRQIHHAKFGMAFSLAKRAHTVTVIEPSIGALLVPGAGLATNLATRSPAAVVAAILMTAVAVMVDDKHALALAAPFNASCSFFHVRSGKRTKFGPR
jgi:hypothetical protein